MWGELLEVMQEELALYRELQAKIETDQEKIVAFDIEGLLASNQRKENLSARLQSLENGRVNRLEEIANFLTFGATDLTLSRLDPHIPEELRPQFRECSSQLRATVQRVHRANQENGRLVRHSLNYIVQSLAFIKNLVEQKSLYLSSGQLACSQGAGKFVERKA